MNILFRVDASFQIGSGHVMRCLTLAKELKKNGNRVIFLCREHEGNLFELIINKGYELYILEIDYETNNDILLHSEWLGTSWKKDAVQTRKVIKSLDITIDWIIVDHYALDYKWEEMIRESVKHILIIDDLADRFHNCDVLVDQNYYNNLSERYSNLTHKTTVKLLGPKYCLIRDEFNDQRKNFNFHHKGNQKNILVFFGGSDQTKETLRILQLLQNNQLKFDNVHIVVGKNNTLKEQIKELCLDYPKFTFHYQINYMSKLLKECYFAICAAGTFTWERYCMGLPGVVVAVAHNQVELCTSIEELKIDKYVGQSGAYLDQDMIDRINQLMAEKNNLKYIRDKAMRLVDGLGKERIVMQMHSIHLKTYPEN